MCTVYVENFIPETTFCPTRGQDRGYEGPVTLISFFKKYFGVKGVDILFLSLLMYWRREVRGGGGVFFP